MIKAVVDTNLLVSSFISPLSSPRESERRWRRGEFVLVTSHEIAEEVNRVLHLPRIQVKYHLAESDIQAFVLTLIHKADCIAVRQTKKPTTSYRFASSSNPLSCSDFPKLEHKAK